MNCYFILRPQFGQTRLLAPIIVPRLHLVLESILTFTIDFETAKRYREANKMPHQFRRAAWTDLTVEVYL